MAGRVLWFWGAQPAEIEKGVQAFRADLAEEAQGARVVVGGPAEEGQAEGNGGTQQVEAWILWTVLLNPAG